MNTIVIEHVPVSDLPAAWRAKLAQSADAHVTVRIEEESEIAAATAKDSATNHPAFGIWRDREDMDDMAAYLRKLRAPRYNRDGSRNAP
jgi:hypothetical protein